MLRINRETAIRYVEAHPRINAAADRVGRWIAAHPRLKAALHEVQRYSRAHPRISTAIALVVALAVVSALQWHFTNNWRRYTVEAMGISVSLPAPPERTSDPAETGLNTVYETRTRHAAIMLAGQGGTDAAPNAPLGSIAKAAMDALKLQKGVDDLKFQIRPIVIDGYNALRVEGIFRRGGAPAGFVGFVGKSVEGTPWQALTFFNDLEGGRIGERVLQSVKLVQR